MKFLPVRQRTTGQVVVINTQHIIRMYEERDGAVISLNEYEAGANTALRVREHWDDLVGLAS